MKVGVDFDRVLFRTDEFVEYLEDKIPGFSEEYPEGIYDPGLHAERLGIRKKKIMHVLRDSEKFLYSDITELEKLGGEHELVLVSRGDAAFQGKKITNSGVCKLFDAIVVIEKGPKDRIDIDYLVDDREVEHDRASVPGFHFDRSKHSLEHVVREVRAIETRKSV